MPMHIAIAGPVATADIAGFLDDAAASLPRGYEGAPLLATLIGELLRRGHRVSAFTLSGDMALHHDAARCARGPRFEMHYLPMRPRAWPFNGWRPGRIVDLYAFERAGLERAIAAARPDVVHAHWSYEFAWAALRTGLPHVVTCHDSPFVIARFQRDLRHGGYRWLRAVMAWHVLRRARHVTTVSPYMVGQIQPLCRAPVHVVPNPLPLPLPPAQASLPRRAGGRVRRVMLASNGWDNLKNTKISMRAFTAWARQRQEVELHLYGHGFELDGPACRWWREQGLQGRAIFHGPVTQPRLLEAMAACDVLLHSALEESFGMVVAEAMAMGLVVIAGRDSGAVPWVVGEDGLLVDVRDAAAMAVALAVLDQDPARLHALRERARQSANRRFGAEAVANAYLQHYGMAMRSISAVGEKVHA